MCRARACFVLFLRPPRVVSAANAPNSIPPEGLQAMAGSLFSPQQITFTQNDFDLTFVIPILDPCM